MGIFVILLGVGGIVTSIFRILRARNHYFFRQEIYL